MARLYRADTWRYGGKLIKFVLHLHLFIALLVLLIEDSAAVRVIITIGEIAAGITKVCMAFFVLIIVDQVLNVSSSEIAAAWQLCMWYYVAVIHLY